MKSSSTLFHGLVLSGLLAGTMPVLAATVVFTSDTTIAASDPTHDGSDIIVDGCTVTVEGSHAYASVLLRNGSILQLAGGGVLEVSGLIEVRGTDTLRVLGMNTTGKVEGLWQGKGGTILANNLTVQAGGLITADGQGYVSSQGPGADPDGGGGGSHGGEGFNGTGRYGSAREPVELGSGGSYSSWSGSGGGAIRLMVTNLFTLEGEVSADGQSNPSYPGGAGGSIWVTAGALSGAGKVTADGGAGGGDNDGGGGRIAVYSDQTVGFSGYGATTAAGDTRGQRGTVAFYNRAGDRLTVYDHFIVEGNTTTTYAQMEVKRGATVLLNGMGTLAVAGTLRLETNTVFWVLSSNRTARVEGLWQGKGGTILANNLTVDAGALITADGQGYMSSQGPGADPDGSGGGSHGGEGSNGTGRYGSAREPVELGSGGSYSVWSGSGGGAIRLMVTNLFTLEGEVSADGQNNAAYPGGAGGSIWVTAGALSGAGKFTADGGAGGGDNDGGGGRIAVYSDQTVGFSGYGATTAAGDTRGQRGTVAFYNRAGDRLTVYDHFIVEGNTTTTYAQMEVKRGATVLLNGMGTLAVAGTLRLETNTVFWVLSSNRTARVEGLWQGKGGTILANNLTVQAGGLITADGQGYVSSQGPGADPDGGGGGSHGGEGFNGTGRYGSAREPVELGSGGSYSSWSGSGGGAIRLMVTNLFTLEGEVSADGQSNPSYPGGAGGSIWVTAGALSGAGKVTADGGAGGGDNDGGGGRIAVYSDQTVGFSGYGA
ncbi:MAG: hypothetical protein KJ072_22110, partial [Verrucomicrobia bacterium]|nr:hypothetical protein [Verrucomicrobiota bacterium]